MWLSGLSIQHWPCCGSGSHCVVDLISLAWELSQAVDVAKKKKKKKIYKAILFQADLKGIKNPTVVVDLIQQT